MNLVLLKEEFLSFANFLSDESAKIIMNYFRKNIEIENKNDSSPVTIADKESELVIRKLIKEKYPNHSIIGEEFENTKNINEYTWVIDPIDGTRSYIAGHKDFGTLIALLHNNIPVLGIINCPAHQEKWVGIKNQSTTLNGINVHTSKKNNIEESYVCTSGLYFEDKNFSQTFNKIIKRTKYHRFGGDCYMYGMLSSGLVDIVIEDTLKVHDYMALVNVIEGAGGKVTDKLGNDISINSDGSVVASSNEKLHNQLISLINL